MSNKNNRIKEYKRNIAHDVFGIPNRKKGINSKEKGDANELVACKVLNIWTGQEFVRIPRSGGLRWKTTQDICGDLLCTNRNFKFLFSVETKHLKSIDLVGTNGVMRKNSRVNTIWQQCVTDGQRSNKIPMMMLRQNGMPEGTFMLYFDGEMYDMIKNKFLLIPDTIHFHEDSSTRGIIGFNSERFFAFISYTNLKKEIIDSSYYSLLKIKL